MRRLRYQVASSLDGFIAGPDGEYDWIPDEPDMDFAELFDQFDTLLIGRRTYEEVPRISSEFAGKDLYVVSSTLRQQDHPGVTIVNDGLDELISGLKARPGKDIWLYGGGELFRSLLLRGHVDTVEPAVMPVLLGRGRRLLPEAPGPWRLVLTGQRVYRKSGTLLLTYQVERREAIRAQGLWLAG
ncbi:MAG: dihydrofolate reductase family protein [Trueperaceae bacterium]